MDSPLTSTASHPIAGFFRLIRFSHTIFALPFALGALLVATSGHPSWRVLILVIICMVLARTAAMVFNRLVDWKMDQRNPRTASRHRLIDKRIAWVLLIITSLAFLAVSSMINRVTGILAPVALLIVFFYSVTKRFTNLTHFFLGLALAVAPAGAWIAATGSLALPPMILGAGVVFWVAGFDLIYATQDEAFDRSEQLHSLVVRLGIPNSLRLAQGLHLLMFVGLIGFGLTAGLGLAYYAALPLVAASLIYEHRTAKALDLAGVNRAFFQTNAFVSAVFVAAVAADRCL